MSALVPISSPEIIALDHCYVDEKRGIHLGHTFFFPGGKRTEVTHTEKPIRDAVKIINKHGSKILKVYGSATKRGTIRTDKILARGAYLYSHYNPNELCSILIRKENKICLS